MGNKDLYVLTAPLTIGSSILGGSVGNWFAITGHTPAVVVLKEALDGGVRSIGTTPGNKFSGRPMGQGVLATSHALI